MVVTDAGTRPSRRRTRAMVSVLALLGVGLVTLTVLITRQPPVRQHHFVRTFSDQAGYANTVSTPTVHVSTVPEPTTGADTGARRAADAASHRVLTMPGGWTSDIGQTVVARAERWLGTPYSFAGGTYTGPTLGTPVDEASRNDGHVLGFDCSGLVMYALAPFEHLTHFAATQYVQAGRMHPTLAQLMPGDLIFWSPDGTVGHVGHVAIYIGNGNVIQAPNSGDVVKITPLDEVEDAAIGTTRPLTT